MRRSPSSAPSSGRHTAQQPARQDPQGPLWAMVERLLREQHSPK
ncbi:MAG: hypothetical protein VB125_03290 [Burkholderia sp.]